MSEPGRNEARGQDCMACQLSDGLLPLPGGLIFRTEHWRVEHCIGPLGLGTLIVKPVRHVTAVADLHEDEAAELGPLLRQASAIAGQLVPSEQVYNCLWSHSGGVPGHIHYVVQPVTADQLAAHGSRGPTLQAAMFAHDETPDLADIERIAELARRRFS